MLHPYCAYQNQNADACTIGNNLLSLQNNFLFSSNFGYKQIFKKFSRKQCFISKMRNFFKLKSCFKNWIRITLKTVAFWTNENESTQKTRYNIKISQVKYKFHSAHVPFNVLERIGTLRYRSHWDHTKEIGCSNCRWTCKLAAFSGLRFTYNSFSTLF